MAMLGLGGSGAQPGQGSQGPGTAVAAPAGRSDLIAGTRIVGDITAPGLLEIQGQVEGRVMADSVVIEDRGTVDGEIHAAAVGIKGTMSGHVAGGAVRVHASARVDGTIRYETLAIESGAEITATCERARAG